MPLTLKQAYDAYTEAWSDVSDGIPRWEPREEDTEKTTGWRLIDTYLRESHVPPDLKPDAVEVPVEADLANHGLPRLIGILDLVQKRQIIDYKTSSTTPNPEKVAHTTEIQTSGYAILYRHNTGNREGGVALHHLVKLKNPKVVITTMPPMSQHQETRLYHQMEAYFQGLQRKDFIPSVGLQCSHASSSTNAADGIEPFKGGRSLHRGLPPLSTPTPMKHLILLICLLWPFTTVNAGGSPKDRILSLKPKRRSLPWKTGSPHSPSS